MTDEQKKELAEWLLKEVQEAERAYAEGRFISLEEAEQCLKNKRKYYLPFR